MVYGDDQQRRHAQKVAVSCIDISGSRHQLKFARQLAALRNTTHFPLWKEGLIEIFGHSYFTAAQNPHQSSCEKGESASSIASRTLTIRFSTNG